MKDGRTHLAYKAEHVIDLQSEVVVAATIYSADRSDGETLLQSVSQAQEAVARAGSDAFAAEVVTDKGYHKAQSLAECAAYDLRTYIPERTERRPRRWTDKPAGWREAFHANRRRVRGGRSRGLRLVDALAPRWRLMNEDAIGRAVPVRIMRKARPQDLTVRPVELAS
jgi:transposase